MEKEKKEKVIQENVVLGSNRKHLIKFIALLSSFFATMLAILMFIFTVISSISIANLDKNALISNNIVVTLLSKLNGYTKIEAESLLRVMNSRVMVIVFEIIIPAIAFIGSMLLLIILSKKVMDFIDKVTYESELFNKKKVHELEDIMGILSVVLLATMVLFNQPSIIFYLLIELLLIVIYLLFKKCSLTKKK